MTTVETAARPEALPLLAAGVTVLAWSSAFVAVRHVGSDFTAGPLALGRLAFGSLVLGLLLLRQRPLLRPTSREWRLLLVCGVLWFGLYNVALNAAERRVDAGTAAMLVNIGPLLIALLAGRLLHEGFPRSLWIGSAFAFSGVVVIGVATSDGQTQIWGVVLCLVAAVAYAVGVVSQKPLLARLPGLQVTWIACTTGLVVTLPYAGTLAQEASRAPLSALGWLVYLGAVPTALGFSTWAYALSRTSAGRMAATTYLVPPLAIGMGWLLLGETPATAAFFGGALCLLGVALSRRR